MRKPNAYTEHVQEPPRGWKVKTLTTKTNHEVKLAFPPGPRRRGSGRLVSIVHPHGENPKACNVNRKMNPSEILILGALNPRKRRGKNPENKIVTEDQAASKLQRAQDAIENFDSDDPNGILSMSPSEYADFKGLTIVAGENPKSKAKAKSKANGKRQRSKSKGKKTARKRNPDGLEQGKQLFKDFWGKDPEGMREMALKTEVAKDYVYLGDLYGGKFLQDDGRLLDVKFGADKIKLASSPDGRQLYCIGGNQDMSGVAKEIGADSSKDLVSLGRWHTVVYLAAKSMTNFEVTEWTHDFGCGDEFREMIKRSEREKWSQEQFRAESKRIMDATPAAERDLPEAVYDSLNKRILFAGGSYYVNWPGIIG